MTATANTTVLDPIRRWAERDPDAIVLRTYERTWTYGEFWTEVLRVAGGLHELGVKQGDNVAVMLDNGPHFLAAWFATNSLGAVEVPVNTDFFGESLGYVLDQSRALALIAEEKYLPRLDDLGHLPKSLEIVVSHGGSVDVSAPRSFRWSELAGTSPRTDLGRRDRAAVMYTSGTTGRSKGAMLSHAYFLNMAEANVANMRLTREDIYYTCLPLFHGMGQLSGTMAPLVAGASIALVPRFSVSRFFDDCRSFGVTGFGAIAAMTAMLHRTPATAHDRDHDIRFAFSVAVPAVIQGPFQERFGIRLIDGYGLTEGGQLTYSPYDAPRVGSCGKPVPIYDVEIHDENGERLQAGEVGEIVARPRVAGACMDGYFENPEASLAAFRDLWLHTGDLGRFDNDGYLYFVDRNKDAIRRRGENISSMEVEALVVTHPAIVEAAAYPVASELGEDDVMVAIVFGPGSDPGWDDVVQHCRRMLPRFAMPRYLRVVDALPRTPTQKTEKFRLRSEGVTSDTYEVSEP